MDEFTHAYTDAATGEVITRPLTEDEIAKVMAKRAAAMAPVVPTSITPRQCRLVLMSQGLLSDVEQAIAGMDEATRITWEYALEFRRDDPLLNALGKNMGLTDEQIDQFFIAASRL